MMKNLWCWLRRHPIDPVYVGYCPCGRFYAPVNHRNKVPSLHYPN